MLPHNEPKRYTNSCVMQVKITSDFTGYAPAGTSDQAESYFTVLSVG